MDDNVFANDFEAYRVKHRTKSKTVLISDDEPAFTKMILRILETKNYRVLTAATCLGFHDFDLISGDDLLHKGMLIC